MDSVLVIGSGGREAAGARAVAQSDEVRKVYVAPGSDGIGRMHKCESVPIPVNEHDRLVNFAEEKGIDFIIIGPEQPLIDGLADRFRKRGLDVFGPGYEGAVFERSKARAKEIMDSGGVPTASYFTATNPAYAISRIRSEWVGPVWVKASGPAAGKGALPGRTPDEAADAVEQIMVAKRFGDAGSEIVVEKHMPGEEASCTLMMNSQAGIAYRLPYSQDHKRLLDNDEGPNTGGMGAYAPTRLITPEVDRRIRIMVARRTLDELKQRGIDYRGALYPGLMVDEGGMPRVVELNVRFGDPEIQAILPLLDDFYVALRNTNDGVYTELRTKPGYGVCVVVAAKGYPESPEKGKRIYGLDREYEGVSVLHAGTKLQDGIFYTNGGRVLNIVATGETMKQALDRVYAAIGRENNGIYFEGMQFRTDIGRRELMRNLR